MAIIEGTCGSKATWTYDDELCYLRISGTGMMTNYGTSGMPWYSFRADIKIIIIDEGITRIGQNAFTGCSSLTSLTIPSTVTSIEQTALKNCTILPELHLPEGVTTLGYSTFTGCNALTSITIPSTVTTIKGASFYALPNVTEIIFLGDQPSMTSSSFALGYNASTRVTATVYTKGWGSDEVFTSSIRGNYTTFTYEILEEEDDTPNFSIVSVSLSSNPVKTDTIFIVSVGIECEEPTAYTWDDLKTRTWDSIKTLTWDEIKGE